MELWGIHPAWAAKPCKKTSPKPRILILMPRVQGLRVEGVGFEVWGLRFRGLGFKFCGKGLLDIQTTTPKVRGDQHTARTRAKP